MEILNTEIQEVVDLYLAKIENFDYLQYTEDELLEETIDDIFDFLFIFFNLLDLT